MKKNPFMSAWLSAYHKNANAAKGLWMAEAGKAQSEMMEQWMDMWMTIWFPWSAGSRRK